MAGLLTARVLSDRFHRVTIIDRDQLPTQPESRRGVPQGRQLHLLLARGEQIVNQLFPGISHELEQAGAIRVDGRDLIWFHEGGYKLRFDIGITLLGMTRPLLESHVGRRVRALPNLTLIEAHEVVRLLALDDRRHVRGIVIRPRGSQADGVAHHADLVVDASGRGSRTPRWLEELGYPKPREVSVQVGIGYTTRFYRRDSSLLPDAQGIYVMPAPPTGKRGGVMVPVEGDRWMVTLAGWLGDHVASTDAGFLDFARTLPADDIYRVIAHAQPLTDPIDHKFPATVRHQYERLDRFPERYVVIGDALCSFNPVYGQGMTVAALEAQALGAILDARLEDVGPRFFKRAAKMIANPWLLAVGADFQFEGVTGPRPPFIKVINRYLAQVHRLAHHDRLAVLTFVEVLMLLRPPVAMFSPRLAFRVARNALFKIPSTPPATPAPPPTPSPSAEDLLPSQPAVRDSTLKP